MHTIDTSVLSYLPTLVVDSNIKHAQRLANHLSQQGFPADFAIDCAAAEAATHIRCYGSIVLVSTLDEHGTLDCLGSLRKRSPGTWIIVINDIAGHDARTTGAAPWRGCADQLPILDRGSAGAIVGLLNSIAPVLTRWNTPPRSEIGALTRRVPGHSARPRRWRPAHRRPVLPSRIASAHPNRARGAL